MSLAKEDVVVTESAATIVEMVKERSAKSMKDNTSKQRQAFGAPRSSLAHSLIAPRCRLCSLSPTQ